MTVGKLWSVTLDCAKPQELGEFWDRWRVLPDPAGHPSCVTNQAPA